jgi:hypothetical protein
MSDAARLPAGQQAAAAASISADGLPLAIERQAAAAVCEAHAVVLVADGQAGLHPSDEEVLSWLRQHHPSKPVVLAVNKCESVTKGATQVCARGVWPRRGCKVAGTVLVGHVVGRVEAACCHAPRACTHTWQAHPHLHTHTHTHTHTHAPPTGR